MKFKAVYRQSGRRQGGSEGSEERVRAGGRKTAAEQAKRDRPLQIGKRRVGKRASAKEQGPAGKPVGRRKSEKTRQPRGKPGGGKDGKDRHGGQPEKKRQFDGQEEPEKKRQFDGRERAGKEEAI